MDGSYFGEERQGGIGEGRGGEGSSSDTARELGDLTDSHRHLKKSDFTQTKIGLNLVIFGKLSRTKIILRRRRQFVRCSSRSKEVEAKKSVI